MGFVIILSGHELQMNVLLNGEAIELNEINVCGNDVTFIWVSA